MRPIIFVFKSIVLLFLFISCSEHETSVEPRVIHFGLIEVNTTYTKQITINNPTNQQIGNISIKPSCTCTAIIQAPTSLQPRSKADLKISYTAPSHPKSFQEMVKVTLNDQQVMLELVGDATKTISVKPDSILALLPSNVSQSSRVFEIISLYTPISNVKNCNVLLHNYREETSNANAFIHVSTGSISEKNTLYGAVVFDAVNLRPLLPLLGDIQIDMELTNHEMKSISIPFTIINKPEIETSQKIITISKDEKIMPPIILQSTIPFKIESIHLDGIDEDIQYQIREFANPPHVYELTILPELKMAINNIQRIMTLLRIRIQGQEEITFPVTIQKNEARR